MNEEELLGAWTTFERTISQRRRINEQVFTWLEAHDTSLAAEWLGLFKTAPAAALGLATVSGAAIIVATPLLWLARALADVLM